MQEHSKQRRFDRSNLQGTVALWRGRQSELMQISSISAGGVFVRSAEPEPLGRLLTLRVHLPNQHGVTVLAKVVRQSQRREASGFGVQFVDISLRGRQAITALVEQQAMAA